MSRVVVIVDKGAVIGVYFEGAEETPEALVVDYDMGDAELKVEGTQLRECQYIRSANHGG